MAMSTTIRMYPPGGAATSITINGPYNGIQGYSAASNGFADVATDGDADSLKAAGWMMPALAGSGTTAQRPPATNWLGQFYVDTTVGGFIWSDGKVWRKFDGTLA